MKFVFIPVKILVAGVLDELETRERERKRDIADCLRMHQ